MKTGYDFHRNPFFLYGRCERIRTFDPLHPMQVRYQAAPHTELAFNYSLRPRRISTRGGQEIANFKQFAAHQQKLLHTRAHGFNGLTVFKVFEL